MKVSSWLMDVKEAPGNEYTQILLIGNKNDLEDRREVETQEGLVSFPPPYHPFTSSSYPQGLLQKAWSLFHGNVRIERKQRPSGVSDPSAR